MMHIEDDRANIDRLREAIGLPPRGQLPWPQRTHGEWHIETLKRSELDFSVIELMRNRLIMGAFRYGKVGAKDKPAYDRVSSIRRRLSLYEQEGNLEHLIDIMNECYLDFVEPTHPKAHWDPSDDSEVHTERKSADDGSSQ